MGDPPLAGRFSQDFIESVRNAGDIVRLVSDYVPLKPAGSRMKGLCPFHEEKTPSFSVDPTRQLFYCFGCQTGGDIFKFVMLYEKMGFGEAAEALAKRWGVPLPATTRRDGNDPRERLLRMTESAAGFFGSRFADGAGSACRAYLKKRRIDDATAERLGVGFAPDAWGELGEHLLSKHFKPKEILTGGLALERKGGTGHYDRFRNRLMFPIRTVGGQTVAFGGRALGDGEPKYINSPETPVYRKGEHLYGLDLAKEAIRKQGLAIVVEGYLDLAAVLQAGFDNVVASLGTAFTPQQARLLARYCNRLAFSYDGDAAGAKATERSLDLLLSGGFDVRIVELPGGTDPDDYIGRDGAEAYGRLLEEAPEYLEFLIRRECDGKATAKLEAKVAAVNAVLPHVARLSGSIERSDWASRLADALQIEDDLVLQELRGAVRSSGATIRQRPAAGRTPREAEARLVSVLLDSKGEQACLADPAWDWNDLEGTQVLPIVRAIAELARQDKAADFATVHEALEDEDDRDLLNRIAFRDEPEDGPTVEDCLWTFKRQKLTREGHRLRRRIGVVPAADVDSELMRLQELARQRDALSRDVIE